VSAIMNWYCDVASGHPWHGPYHDEEYGFPLDDDQTLFERLCLEIFQAGLSWLIVLKKRDAMRAAFDGFDPVRVAAYGTDDVERLMANSGIIRNRRKVLAVIENARRVVALASGDYGSFAGWLAAQPPMGVEDWLKLFKKSFVFMGREVVNEFLMSIALIPGAHRPDCPVQLRIDAEKTNGKTKRSCHFQHPKQDPVSAGPAAPP
jgi:DNA-3-methyladenine glycosylase I